MNCTVKYILTSSIYSRSNDVLLDCAGFNSLRISLMNSNQFLTTQIFNRITPNTVLEFLAKINDKNMI